MERYRALGVSRLVLAILAVPLLLAACGDSSKGPKNPLAGKKVEIPKVDPAAPFPAMSGAVLDALAADVPELAKVKETVLAAEREALKGAFDIARAKSQPAGKSKPAGKKVGAAILIWLPAAGGTGFSLISAALAGEGTTLTADNLLALVAANSIITIAGDGISNQDTSQGGGSKSVTMPGKEAGTVDASMTLSAKAGGPMTAELVTKVDMPVFFLQANSKMSVTGDLCPDPDGKVEFTIRLASDGRAGSKGSSVYDRNVEAKITATVGDDANTTSADIEMKQATRSTAGGRQVYIESGMSARVPGGDMSNAKMGEVKVIRASSQATQADTKLIDEGLVRAFYLATGALHAAERHWQGGGCIRIYANSPGTVQPGATTKLPVEVKHRKDGSSHPAKVAVQLTGGASVNPGTIAKAPGDVTHVAVKERQKIMTIALTATSKRGKDALELKLSTGGLAYTAEGGGPGLKITGRIDDVSKPFSLKGQGQGFTLALEYTPTSEKGGTMTYHGTGGGVVQSGKGPYTIVEEDWTQGGRKGMTLTATPTGCVTGPMFKNCRTTKEVVTLTPAD